MKKLIIDGKAWGEYKQAWVVSGDVEVEGYRSYGGVHTVRPVDREELTYDQQTAVRWLKNLYASQVDCGLDEGAAVRKVVKRLAYQDGFDSLVLQVFLDFVNNG